MGVTPVVSDGAPTDETTPMQLIPMGAIAGGDGAPRLRVGKGAILSYQLMLAKDVFVLLRLAVVICNDLRSDILLLVVHILSGNILLARHKRTDKFIHQYKYAGSPLFYLGRDIQ